MQEYMLTRRLIELADRDAKPLLEEIEIFELANAPKQLAFSDRMVYLVRG